MKGRNGKKIKCEKKGTRDRRKNSNKNRSKSRERNRIRKKQKGGGKCEKGKNKNRSEKVEKAIDGLLTKFVGRDIIADVEN